MLEIIVSTRLGRMYTPFWAPVSLLLSGIPYFV
jgi:hypothetical protein